LDTGQRPAAALANLSPGGILSGFPGNRLGLLQTQATADAAVVWIE
jgi:hypothetical protein